MLGNYQKYFKTDLERLLWKTSWVNMVMNFASIPDYSETKKDDVEVISPENEAESLRNNLGL